MTADDILPSFEQPQSGFPSGYPPPQQQPQQYLPPQQTGYPPPPQQFGYPPQAAYPPPQGGHYPPHQQAPYSYGGGTQQAPPAGFEHGYGQQQYAPPQQTIVNVQVREETSIPVHAPSQINICAQYIPTAELGYIMSLSDFVSSAEHTEMINSINSIFRQEFSEIARISMICNVVFGVLFVVGFGLFISPFFRFSTNPEEDSTMFLLPSIGFVVNFCSIIFLIISRLVIKSHIEKAWASSTSAISIVSASKLEERGVQYRVKREEIPVININTGRYTGFLTEFSIVVDISPSATPLSQIAGSQDGSGHTGQDTASGFSYGKQ